MKKTAILITALSLLLSSCATILNGKYQKIEMYTDYADEVLINDEKAIKKNGKYLFKRDLRPKQITIKTKDYKDENFVIMQHKKSPLHIISWIPFGITLVVPLYDRGNRSWNYDKEIEYTLKRHSIKNKKSDSKEIKINKISVDLEKQNIKYRNFNTYKGYILKRKNKVAKSSDSEEEIKIENTIFSIVLNNLLKDKGYIDTTRMVFKDSYLNNLLVNAKITEYTIHHIYSRFMNPRFGGMVYLDLSIDWEVLDYYEKPIYSMTTNSRSGEFAILEYYYKDDVVQNAIKDVMEISLIEFMNTEKVNFLMHDREEIVVEESFEEINIPKSDLHVSNLSQAIKSSLTVKSKNGFGSGFIISSDGYIITNYHVVSGSTDLKVILNDKSEHEVEVIRVSKIYDLALLKIEPNQLIPFKINKSKDIEIALEVYAIGTPTAEDLSQTLSRGIISGIREPENGSKLIQTDASINSGNSGGPLVNKDGLVLGVVSSKIKGFSIEGVAFGIPAYEILDKLNINIK